MTSLYDDEGPDLPPEAVDLLAAIRDHLDPPLYIEGDKKGRRAYRETLELRAADVVGILNSILAVPVTDATEHARELRKFAADVPLGYATTGERGDR